MGGIRVTQGIMIDQVLKNLNLQELRLLGLQEQLSTGLRVNRPSDDPLAARRGMAGRTELQKSDQYLANISAASPYIVETEFSVLTSVEILQRAKDLAIQGANGTNAQLQRDQIALEVNQLLEGLLEQGNHATSGRYVFGGTRTLSAPFVESRDAQGEITSVAYVGNDEHIRNEFSDGVLVNINETGQDAFLGAGSTFQALIDLRDSLRAGDSAGITTGLVELDAGLNNLFVSIARIGATANRVDRLESNLRDIKVQLEKVVSDNLDADFAEVIVALNAQSNSFEASLNAAGRVIQPSLLQFLG